ncbi:MAG: hypothetical protein R2788_10390 [Saprospiraceae bacterium]
MLFYFAIGNVEPDFKSLLIESGIIDEDKNKLIAEDIMNCCNSRLHNALNIKYNIKLGCLST